MAAKDDYDLLSQLADRLYEDDDTDGKTKWLNLHMNQLGYKPSVSWMDADPNDGGNSDPLSNLFGNKQRERREVGRRTPQKKTSGDWQYGS